jgi:hypothetical protein
MKLRDIARVVRTKNTGALLLTIDVMFENEGDYLRVKSTGVLSEELFAGMFHCPLEKVRVIDYPPAFALKCTVPRLIRSGDHGDSDIYGCQQHALLMDVEVPEG